MNVFQWQMDFIQIYLLVVLQENIMRWREDIALLQPRERVVVNWENCLWHLGPIIGSSVWISVKGMTVWRCPRLIWSTQELESIWVTDFQCSLNASFFFMGSYRCFFIYTLLPTLTFYCSLYDMNIDHKCPSWRCFFWWIWQSIIRILLRLPHWRGEPVNIRR